MPKPDEMLEIPEIRWVMFTKRTNDPKLSWLERQLRGRETPTRRNGESFHAPILEVPEERLTEANQLLDLVDDIADDDVRWEKELAQMCCCDTRPLMVLDMYPPICTGCGRHMFLLVKGR